MPKTFLLEILTEDLPARAVEPALYQLKARFGESLKKEKLSFAKIETLGTNRRIAVVVEGLSDKQEDFVEEIVGPPAKVAFDAKENPTETGIKFAESRGGKKTDLKKKETPKGIYAVLILKRKGKTAEEILAPICAEVLGKLEFPITMRWGSGEHSFIRPVHSILAMLDKKAVPFEFCGVKSGNSTFAHRFLAKNRKIKIADAKSYKNALRKGKVVADREERIGAIVKQLSARAREAKGECIEDAELLKFVSSSCEYPTVLRGKFEERFLALPREVLIASMREHQKYFAVSPKKDSGALMPYFLTTADVSPDAKAKIVGAHERVLRARLQDAEFFYESDRKQKLSDRAEKLKAMVFVEELGSYYDKTQRVARLAMRYFAQRAYSTSVGDAMHKDFIEKAAILAKCDLATQMVYEFPSLQGIMGGVYAQKEGYHAAVWRAIYEHYKPVSPDDALPTTLEGAVLSLADKMDTIAGCFNIGLIPSGTKDPHGLRRAGVAVVRLLLYEPLSSIDLKDLTENAFSEFPQKESAKREAENFIKERFISLCEKDGNPIEVVNAVLKPMEKNRINFRSARLKIEALFKMRSDKDILSLAIAFKRVQNIIKDQKREKLNEESFAEEGERALHRAAQTVQKKIEANILQKDYLSAFRALASIRPAVDEFFDDVLVMTEDEKLRANRVALLWNLSDVFLRLADISELAISVKEPQK